MGKTDRDARWVISVMEAAGLAMEAAVKAKVELAAAEEFVAFPKESQEGSWALAAAGLAL